MSSSLRDLFPKWLRHEGKSRPREEATENPRVVTFVTWAMCFAHTGTAFGRNAGFASQPKARLRREGAGFGHRAGLLAVALVISRAFRAGNRLLCIDSVAMLVTASAVL
ncbi:hypothetical protein GCM10027271_27360 [Saccharopolyspora gloriosae]